MSSQLSHLPQAKFFVLNKNKDGFAISLRGIRFRSLTILNMNKFGINVRLARDRKHQVTHFFVTQCYLN